MLKTLEFTVQQPLVIKTETAEYSLIFPVLSLVFLEETLGRPMRSAADWFRMEPKEIAHVIEAGLRLHHSTEARAIAEAVCACMTPEACESFIEAVCATNWPAFMRRFEDSIKKIRETGQVPNAPSVAVH